MIKKVLIIVIIFYGVSIIQSCCTEELSLLWIDFSIATIDNSGEIPVITNSMEVSKKTLGFRITMQDSIWYAIGKTSLINHSYATTCAQVVTSTTPLISISVRTLSDYSAKYPIDSDITNLFMARISDDINTPYETVDEMTEYLNTIQYYHQFDLYLLDTTAYSGQHQFELQIETSEDNFTHKTDTVNLF